MEVIKSLVNNVDLSQIENETQLFELSSKIVETEQLDFVQTKQFVKLLYAKYDRMLLN